jgi:alpha-aminoadipate carrier protein LysW
LYAKLEDLKMSLVAECPECAADVGFPDDAVMGEIVQCPDCNLELEIISLDPPELAQAPEEEEDWGE